MPSGDGSTHLTVSAEVTGSSARVALRGEVDTATSEQLQAELDRTVEAGARSIDLDLSAIGFIDSWGLRVLIRLHERLSALDGRLRVVAAGDQTRRLLTMTGLGGLLADAEDQRARPDEA